MLYLWWIRTGTLWLQWFTILAQPASPWSESKEVLACRPKVWCLGIGLPPPRLTGRVQCRRGAGGHGFHCQGEVVIFHWEVEVSHVPDARVATEGEDGLESKWVVGFMWRIDEPVNRNFPLYIADTAVNLFMDCISYYLWNLISNCFLLCSILPTSAIPSNASKCWFFGLAIYFFWFLFVLPHIVWFDSDCELIRNKYENQYRNYLC